MSRCCPTSDDNYAAFGAIGTSSRPPRPYAFPVPGGYITSFFGPRTHPVTKQPAKAHGALDIGAQPGAEGKPIIAPEDGVVIWRSDDVTRNEGRSIGIRHDDGWTTSYSHLLTSPMVKGQRVTRGQVIAFMGNTGRSTGPHLHWVVMDPSGTKVDPLLVLTGAQAVEGGGSVQGEHSGNGGVPWFFLVVGAAALWMIARKR